MANINTKYKRFNGTSWDVIYFETSAGQVLPTTTRKFVTSSTKVNGVGFTLSETDGSASVTINGSNINFTGTSGNYITKDTTLNVVLSALDSAVKAAKDAADAASSAIPEGVLTTSNYSTTLNDVYQAKDADLTAIASLTGTSGLLKKTAANTWALDTNTYITGNQTIEIKGDASGSGTTSISLTLANSGVSAGTYKSVTVDAKGRVTNGTNPTTLAGYGITDAVPNTRKVNGKALSSDITLGASDIAYGNSTVSEALSGVVDVASGRTATYIVTTTTASAFNSNNDDITLSSAFTDDSSNSIALSTLKLGDIILVKETNVPDRWVSAKTSSSVTLSKMETAKVTIGKLVTNATTAQSTSAGEDFSGTITLHKIAKTGTFSDLLSKPTTIAGYGITDAKIDGGVITLGSNTITPLTSASTLDASKLTGTLPSDVYTDTKYGADRGISLVNGKFGHSNTSVTAKTSYGSTSTTASADGGTIVVTDIKYDAYGHITSSTDRTITLSQVNTKNTAGSTNKASTKLFLIGAESQGANPQTYSNVKCYVGTDNSLYSNSNRVPTIYYADNAPSSGAIEGDICIEF